MCGRGKAARDEHGSGGGAEDHNGAMLEVVLLQEAPVCPPQHWAAKVEGLSTNTGSTNAQKSSPGHLVQGKQRPRWRWQEGEEV